MTIKDGDLMKGSVTRDRNRWRYSIELEGSLNGKRNRKWVNGFDSEKEAEQALKEAQDRIRMGYDPEKSDWTLSEYIDHWLEKKQLDIKPTTYRNYVQSCNANLKPVLGGFKIKDISPKIIDEMKMIWVREGKSNRDIAYNIKMLSMALNQAAKDQIIPFNPAGGVSRPKKKSKEILPISDEDFIMILEKSKEPYRIAMLLAYATGMREREIAGLQWRDIDFENKRLYVRRRMSKKFEIDDVKSKAGRRNISLDDGIIKKLIKARLGLKNQRGTGFVVQLKNGQPVNPDYLGRAFKRCKEKAGLDIEATFHTIRHTHASILLKAGVHPKVVQERLGHSSIQITLDTYSHLIPSMQEEAMKNIKVTSNVVSDDDSENGDKEKE